jgi:hypothetical protein
MKNILIKLLIVGLAAVSSRNTRAQDGTIIELNAQGILAKVDDIMRYPDGLLKGKIMHIFPDGKSFSLDVEGSILKNDYVFNVSSHTRGDQLRILYNLDGEDIWVYNLLAIQLFHKIDVDKYDPVMQTNFAFIDLSRAALQSNYTAQVLDSTVLKGFDVYRLNLTPVFKKGEYGKLTLYVTKDEFYPLRIDYHDRDKVIVKTLQIAKGAEFNKRKFPIRYDMLNVPRGTLTILQFTSLDDSVQFKGDLFRHENLGNKK